MGKKYQQVAKLIDSKKFYTLPEALALAKQTSFTKFEASVELHCHLGIDPAKSEQNVRGALTLPHSTGKTKRVAAFVDPANEGAAKQAGADVVATERTIEEIASTGKLDFEVAVATPAMMSKLTKIAKILGPKGLMPSPKAETVTADIQKVIAEIKKGKLNFKNDDTGNVHVMIGKVSLSGEQLLENAQTFLEALRRAKPAASKGVFLRSCTVTSTMGPGIPVQV